ncbi:MAG: TetR/AcrR family transcriptional regulator [Pseudomonadota bacterium]
MARKQGSHSDITGPRIQTVALRLFAEHGYAAVSMRQIAAEVGVQAGAIYNYVPHKQALLFELMRAHMEDLLSASAKLKGGSPGEALDEFVRFHILYHLERVDLVFISYMELRSLEPANFTQIEALRRAYEDKLETILKAGKGKLFDVADTKVATFALIAMLTGPTNWFRPGKRLGPEDVAQHYVEMARRLVGAPLRVRA